MVRRAAPSPMRGLALLVIVGFADGFCSSRARHGFAPLASRADRAADEGVGEGVRINKRFGELLSRREADRAVIAGRVPGGVNLLSQWWFRRCYCAAR